MLGRYQMKRGVPRAALPKGERQDARKHTRHVLRPGAEEVAAYLSGQIDWDAFADAYRAQIAERFETERDRFDALAARAREADVWLGCSCPTQQNPDVRRCHTWLALEEMARRYPDLEIRFPDAP